MVVEGGPREVCDGTPPGSIPHSSTIYFCINEIRKKLFCLIERASFWFYTGMFFNKVNQAESMDFSLALGISSEVFGGERNP